MKRLTRACARGFLAVGLSAALPAMAGPLIEPGSLAMRSDIQRLADQGIIGGPTSTWPLAWGPILDDLEDADLASLAPGTADAVLRLRRRARLETQTGRLGFDLEVGVAEKPARIRSFEDTPRGDVELAAGADWLGERFAIDVNVQVRRSAPDGRSPTTDNSMLGIVVGNWSLAASTQERWWGPGWDGSLILSNNARPVPALTLDRVFTDAFEWKFLRWLGPWDANLTFGQLESRRAVADARFFGMRFNFRPLPSLEIGLSRTAQWCGRGRPCGFDTLVDLLVGRDNVGDAGIGAGNEPGNQLAGVDFRWVPRLPGRSLAVYGQFIGEDEAGGFPSRYIGQAGGEWSGYLLDRWSARLFIEFAGTSCQFHESSELFNCAYNHGIYRTGYRYRGRAIGHAADNDARLVSTGLVLADADDTEWRGLLRYGRLNRGGTPDASNTLTAIPQEIASMDIAHSRNIGIGVIEVGVGVERIDDTTSAGSATDARMYATWRQLF